MPNKNVWIVSLDFWFYMSSSRSKYVTVVLCYIFLRFHFHQVLPQSYLNFFFSFGARVCDFRGNIFDASYSWPACTPQYAVCSCNRTQVFVHFEVVVLYYFLQDPHKIWTDFLCFQHFIYSLSGIFLRVSVQYVGKTACSCTQELVLQSLPS